MKPFGVWLVFSPGVIASHLNTKNQLNANTKILKHQNTKTPYLCLPAGAVFSAPARTIYFFMGYSPVQGKLLPLTCPATCNYAQPP